MRSLLLDGHNEGKTASGQSGPLLGAIEQIEGCCVPPGHRQAAHLFGDEPKLHYHYQKNYLIYISMHFMKCHLDGDYFFLYIHFHV